MIEAGDALALLEDGPTAEQLAASDVAIARAEADLLQSAESLAEATGQLGIATTLAGIVAGDVAAPGEVVLALLLEDPGDQLVAAAGETLAAAQFEVARQALEQAIIVREDLLAGATASGPALARQELALAEAQLPESRKKRQI